MSIALSHTGLNAAAMFGLTVLVAAPSTPLKLIGTAEAQAMKPIEEPITGNEELGDLATDSLSQPKQALVQFYKAFNTRDLKMIDDNFLPSDEVAIDNPLGGIRRGADEPHKMYQGIFKSPADVHVVFWDYTIDRVGDVFWAVGRERGTFLDGGAVKPLNIRTSRIFQLVDGRWRQIHHHGSIADAKLLEEFQSAVRSAKTPTAMAPVSPRK